MTFKFKMMALVILLAGQCFAAPGFNLYTDRKGKQAGDVLTVMVVESAKATNNAQTQTDSKNKNSFGLENGAGSLDFIPGMGMGTATNSGFEGRGLTSRNGSLKATVTVKIEEVMDNGNLRISGFKEVTLNEETEILEVSGTIRPEDISSDNTVYSYKIADAVIRYKGDGTLTEAEEPGMISRFFNWIF
jgi:flagellar L-ring protein precursor FlgH